MISDTVDDHSSSEGGVGSDVKSYQTIDPSTLDVGDHTSLILAASSLLIIGMPFSLAD
jgi:hypothetical protein